MTVKNLYKYETEKGTVITPIPHSESDEPYMYRLIADEGKVLTNGETMTYCIDTHEVEEWEEVDDPTPPEEIYEGGDFE